MKQTLGLWSSYRSGEVADFLENFLGSCAFADTLRKKEAELGNRRFIESLIQGLDLTPLWRGPKAAEMRLFLRSPHEKRELTEFLDQLSGWLEGNGRGFLDICFFEHRGSLFHSPLERSLKKRFGFGLEYKVLIEEGE